MLKSLSCRDGGADGDFPVCASTEEEILEKAREHARSAHHMDEIPKDVYEKARFFMFSEVFQTEQY